jgi:hypothetical protein
MNDNKLYDLYRTSVEEVWREELEEEIEDLREELSS